MTGVGHRLGRFEIRRSLLEQWNDLVWLFGNVVVVEAAHRWDTDSVEYLAYSPLFDECEPAVSAPRYVFTCNTRTMPATITVERVPERTLTRLT